MPYKFRDPDYMVSDTVDGRDINMLSGVSALMKAIAQGGTVVSKDGVAILPKATTPEQEAYMRSVCLGATERLDALVAMISVLPHERPALAEKLKADYAEMYERKMREGGK